MFGNLYQVIIFSAALLFFCWLLLEYLLNRKGREPEGGLYLTSKTAFAFTHFWKAVGDAKELPGERIREEAENTPIGPEKGRSGIAQMQNGKEKESGALNHKKFYRRQM